MGIFGYELAGKHFIANIAVDPKTDSGLEVVNRDPRKWRLPPNAYAGKVEECGPRCDMVHIGDMVTIQRWSYLQMDIDDERIQAHQDHVLLINGHPVNGVIVLVLIKDKERKSGLILPEGAVEKEHHYAPSYHGLVYASSVDGVNKDDEIWIQKSNHEQWKMGTDKLIFRWDNPDKNEMSQILAIRQK